MGLPVSRATALALIVAVLVAGLYQTPVTFPETTPGDERIEVRDLPIASGQTAFVPAYSEIPFATDRALAMSVTLAIHNTDPTQPIIITSAR